MKIGFSTGCLYRTNLSFSERLNWFKFANSNVVELNFLRKKELEEFENSSELNNSINEFEYVSIHAPTDLQYGNNENTEKVITKLKKISELYNIEGIVIHPDTIIDFKVLENSGLPILIENMDSNKKWGTHPEHLEKIKQDYNFGFVFDIQHAYEHDNEMELGKEILDVFGNKLTHIHVSGCTDKHKHWPVYLSDNKLSLAKILELKLSQPKIFEGVIEGNIAAKLKKEMQYLTTLY
jgi:hypothetical protein